MRVFHVLDELIAAAGTDLGVSAWMRIDQERIQLFADATGDQQWIHVDVERAKRESPFGEPVAHGFLILALLPQLRNSVFRIEGVKAGINYGLNRVRFIAPVPVDAKIRARVLLKAVEPKQGGRVLVTMELTMELQGSERPACIAETIGLYVM